jgi:hypothetical protein
MMTLGYYDGTTAGVIQFRGAAGPVYHFVMPDEDEQLCRPFGTPREFAFAPLPADALDRLEVALSPYIPARWPNWGVSWQFPTPEAEAEADARVGAILAETGPVEWRVALPWNWTFENFHPVRMTASQPV